MRTLLQIKNLAGLLLFLVALAFLAGCPAETVQEEEEFFFPRDMYPYEFEAEPELEAPDRLLFLNLEVGDEATRRAAIRNVGRRSLTLDGLTLEGPFTMNLVDHAGSPPEFLIPGETLYVDVTYVALDEDPRTGILTIESDDPTRPVHEIDLLANVELPCIQIVPSTVLRYGPVILEEELERTIRIINCSENQTAKVEITDFLSDDGFALVNPADLTAPRVLEPGTSQLVPITFAPAEARGYEGAITFQSEDLDNPVVTVTLRGTGSTQACASGSISGRACTPDQQTLAGANVTVSGTNCEGIPFDVVTTANSEGFFSLDEVPVGTHTITVSLGSFSGSEFVEIRENRNTDLGSDGVCLDGSDVPIAILTGSYDDIGALLNNLQIEYDRPGSDGFFGVSANDARDFLTDINTMMDYQILFIECGELWSQLGSSGGGFFGGSSVHDQVIANLRTFVQSGRSLYASDRAYQFVSRAFPEAVNFRPDTLAGSSQTVTAQVISDAMFTLLGTSHTQINFNLGGWAVMSSPPPGVTVHFQGPVRIGSSSNVQAPLLISYSHSSGGTVIYTSFHNNAQVGLGSDMERILRYLIFQL